MLRGEGECEPHLIIGSKIVSKMKLCQLISPQLITPGAGRGAFIIPERVVTRLEAKKSFPIVAVTPV